jgi:hypothetical protein
MARKGQSLRERQVTTRFSREELEQLQTVAVKEERSVSAQLRLIVREWHEKQQEAA